MYANLQKEAYDPISLVNNPSQDILIRNSSMSRLSSDGNYSKSLHWYDSPLESPFLKKSVILTKEELERVDMISSKQAALIKEDIKILESQISSIKADIRKVCKDVASSSLLLSPSMVKTKRTQEYVAVIDKKNKTKYANKINIQRESLRREVPVAEGAMLVAEEVAEFLKEDLAKLRVENERLESVCQPNIQDHIYEMIERQKDIKLLLQKEITAAIKLKEFQLYQQKEVLPTPHSPLLTKTTTASKDRSTAGDRLIKNKHKLCCQYID